MVWDKAYFWDPEEYEKTCKRKKHKPILQNDGTIRLHPENERFEDIVVDTESCIIQGVAVKILKDAR